MQVVYRSLEKTIREAIYAADLSNRKISHINLSESEIRELYTIMYPLHHGYGAGTAVAIKDPASYASGEMVGQMYGVEIRKA